MSRIFECLGEFGLVDYQYALLDYLYNMDPKVNILPYSDWIKTLRHDEMRKGYTQMVLLQVLNFISYVFKIIFFIKFQSETTSKSDILFRRKSSIKQLPIQKSKYFNELSEFKEENDDVFNDNDGDDNDDEEEFTSESSIFSFRKATSGANISNLSSSKSILSSSSEPSQEPVMRKNKYNPKLQRDRIDEDS